MKRLVSYEKLFEQLEPRQMRSVTSPSPEDGSDYHLALNNNGSVVVSTSTEIGARVKESAFQWFDGTPDHGVISNGGDAFERARVDGYYMWPDKPGFGPDTSGDASESGVRFLARQVASQGAKVIIIDNETWSFDIRYSSPAVVTHTIQRMKQLLGWIRDEEPSLKIGIYGYLSQSDDTSAKTWPESQLQISVGHPWFTAALPDYSNSFARWQATSEFLRPLSESVDYVFPALYTGVDDPDEWEKSARTTIEDSRRYGKPVIPFIWPYYHQAVGEKGFTAIPTDVWERELALVKQYADGAFIWDDRQTDVDAPWLAATIAASQTDVQGAAPLMVAAQVFAAADSAADDESKFNDSPISDLLAQI